MFNQYATYFSQRGLNIFLCTEASLIECLNPFLSDKQKGKTLCLLASGGKALWEKIPTKVGKDPIDLYSKRVINEFSKHFFHETPEILFPAPGPLLPLQQIGRHFNIARPSVLGLDISPEYGLWFAYRGVFLLEAKIEGPLPSPFTSFCEDCSRPCLKEKDLSLAREICPIHVEHQYSQEQKDYHQEVLSRELLK